MSCKNIRYTYSKNNELCKKNIKKSFKIFFSCFNKNRRPHPNAPSWNLATNSFCLVDVLITQAVITWRNAISSLYDLSLTIIQILRWVFQLISWFYYHIVIINYEANIHYNYLTDTLTPFLAKEPRSYIQKISTRKKVEILIFEQNILLSNSLLRTFEVLCRTLPIRNGKKTLQINFTKFKKLFEQLGNFTISVV